MNPNKEPFESFYDVLEEIGKGHFAVVKRCVNKQTGIAYAGKFIKKRRVCRGVPLEEIQREVETLARMEHPGIIQFHDVFETGQNVVLLLELVTGGELYEFVSEQKCLSEPHCIHIIHQILDAVSHMHSQNIAHLDLKPENVLLVEKTEMPTVKVIDFGLSHRLDTVAEVKAMFGTPEFVAPEVVNFEKLTLATDMWAIGVITYILLSGASPFLGDTVQETYSNVSSASYSFDSVYFENVSDLAKDFISRLLQKDPRSRDSVFDSLRHPWLQQKVTEIMSPPVTLLSAIKEGDMKTFEDMLNSGQANVDQTNKEGETGLHLAASEGREEMARLLLVCGANTSLVDSRGDTALIRAARHASTAVLILLIKAGASVSIQNQEGETALHVAAAWGELEIARILVENGALLHIPNHLGQLPLHLALLRRHSRLALYLLSSGADSDLHDSDGNAPIHLAVREGLTSVVKALCSLGCCLDTANNLGLCPIHIAARQGHTEIVRLLCLSGCNTEARNADGIKAEITALKYGFNDISDLLNKVRSNYTRKMYIRQLVPNGQPLPRCNIQLFGHSGVGKSTLVDTLKTGYISGLFKRSKTSHFTNYPPLLSSLSQPSSPSRTHIELDATSRQNSLNFDLYNQQSTQGIDVQQAWITDVGYVTLWDFSGQDTYFCFYHHMLSPSAVFLLVVNLEDSPSIQYKQCCFWLTFIQARLPPIEPIGNCGETRNTAEVILVATHADRVRAPRLPSGALNSPQASALVKRLKAEFWPYFHIQPSPIVVDGHQPNSFGVKLLKSTISQLKNSLHRRAPEMTGFCEAVLSWLPSLRKSAESLPVMTWEAFLEECRSQVNPLAGPDHFSLLFRQLQEMGEVVLVEELMVLNPGWLCGEQVLGQLLSLPFITRARITGCYTLEDFQFAFPQADSMAILTLLEALQLCIQCENDGEVEYEFPCYNLVERLDGLWDMSDPRYREGAYGGVRLRTPEGTTHLLHAIFPRLQIELRRVVSGFYEWGSDLYQWLGGSKLCLGPMESLITLEPETCGGGGGGSSGEAIELKVRGPPASGKNCFLFLEELLGIVDMVLMDVVPGLVVEKHYLSPYDLRTHANPPHAYPPQEVMAACLGGLDSLLCNPLANLSESVLELIAFGALEEVRGLLERVDCSSLSSLTKQRLCRLLDPTHPQGRDWCLLAVGLGLTHRVSSIETAPGSRTAALLEEYSSQPDNTVDTLIQKLVELGREDASELLLKTAPLYKLNSEPPPLTSAEGGATTPSDSSRNLSR